MRELFAGRTAVLPCIIFCVAAYLSLVRLNDKPFWDDEAAVAFLAKSYTATGKPGFDSRNLFTFRNGSLLTPDLQTISPPLEYLMVAASFKVFGATTLAGRLPFAIMGIAALAIFWFVLKLEFVQFRILRLYAFALMGLSYSFLLSIRQCRYYAAAIFFSVLAYYLYKKLLASGQWRYAVLLLATSVAYFYTNYLLCGAFLVALAFVHMFHNARRTGKRQWIALIGVAALFIAAMLPALLKEVWLRPDIRNMGSGHFSRLALVFLNFKDLDVICYLPGIAMILLLALAVLYRKKALFPRTVLPWVTLVIVYTIALSFASAQGNEFTGKAPAFADVRYLVALIPFAAGITGSLLYMIHISLGGTVAILFAGILLYTNLLSFDAALHRFRWLLPAFISEVHTHYTTPYEAVISYLDKNASPDDVIFSSPEYTLLVPMFYLGDKLRTGSMLRKTSALPADTVRKLGIPVYIDDYFPDWYICYGMGVSQQQGLEFFSRDRYRYVPAKVLDTYCNDMTRPELPLHSFSAPSVIAPSQRIFIFRRLLKE
jgi:hypothetical protein